MRCTEKYTKREWRELDHWKRKSTQAREMHTHVQQISTGLSTPAGLDTPIVDHALVGAEFEEATSELYTYFNFRKGKWHVHKSTPSESGK